MSDEMVIRKNSKPAHQGENRSVQDWWDYLVGEGVDPDEEHVVAEVVYKDESHSQLKVLAKGNLMECLVAASYSEGPTKIMTSEDFAESVSHLQ